MRRLLGIVATVALLAIVCAATNPTALAQKDKDKKEKDAKKEKDKDVKKGGLTIELQESTADGKFRFYVRNADEKLLASSSINGFATEKDARAALEELKDGLAKAKITKTKKEAKKEKVKEKKEK